MLALAGTTGAVSASAKGAKVSHLGNPPAVLRHGARFAVKFRSPVPPRFWLSRDARHGAADVQVKAKVRIAHRRGTAKLRVPAHLATGTWFLVACPGSSSHGCATSQRVGMVPVPHRFAQPVHATTKLDSAAVHTATIGSAGGMLAAKAANGTRFTLSVPKGSVPDGTKITMTPWTSLVAGGLRGVVVGGVQLAPEGLALVRGATLTITPKHAVPLRRQVGLGYSGGGAGLQAVPLGPSRSKIQVPVAHFSGYGLDNSPTGPAGAPAASDDTGFYDSMLAQILGDLRDGDMSSDDADKAVASVFDDWLKAIMADEVPPGLTADDPARVAIRDLLTWARDNALITGAGSDSAAIRDRVMPTVAKLAHGIYHRAQQRCVTNHDITEIGRNIVPQARDLALLGAPVPTSELYQCLRFKLELDSQVRYDAGKVDSSETGSWQWHYQASVEIKPDLSAPVVSGSVPLDGTGDGTYADASGTVTTTGDCGVNDEHSTTTESLLSGVANSVQVPGLTFTISGQTVGDVKLDLNSSATEQYQVQEKGDCQSGPTNYDSARWWTDVLVTGVIRDGTTPNPDGSMGIDLDRASGDVFAQKTLDASDGGGYSGTTTLTLIHDPPPAP